MPHLELSLIEPTTPRRRGASLSSLRRWATAVSEAGEPSLVIDADAVVVAVSPGCDGMIAFSHPVVGRKLTDVLRLLDFSAAGVALEPGELGKIPPLLALASGRLARGLVRVESPDGSGSCTLDAIATPLLDGTRLAGSMTFFSPV